MIYKTLWVLLFVVKSFSAEVETKQIDEFIKNMTDPKSTMRFSETYFENRIIDGFKVKQVQKIKDIYEAEIEFNVVSINRQDEATLKYVMAKLPEPRKETMKYKFVMRDAKLMLSEVPHPFSYSLKSK